MKDARASRRICALLGLTGDTLIPTWLHPECVLFTMCCDTLKSVGEYAQAKKSGQMRAFSDSRTRENMVLNAEA